MGPFASRGVLAPEFKDICNKQDKFIKFLTPDEGLI